jgi:precorrin-2 dehydrogenase/sirohydrochlorin ferrochelatase
MLTATFFARRPVLVVGGGKVAERRVKTLLEAGAKLRLIAPRLTPGLAELAAKGRLDWTARGWQPGDLAAYPAALLVFAATDDPATNAAVEAEAREQARLVNRADRPEDCDFTLPGVVRSGDLTLTVSTSGQAAVTGLTASPALTAYLRQKLGDTIGPEYSRLAALLGELRPQVKREVTPPARPQLWRKMVESGALELLRQQREDEARQLLEGYVREASPGFYKHDFRFEPGKSGKEVRKRPQKSVSSESPNKEANTTNEENY